MTNSKPPSRAEVSDEEIREWAQEPVTKHFVKQLIEARDIYKEQAISYYVEGNMEQTFGNIAELAGAIKCIDTLLEASVGGTIIFNVESISEGEIDEYANDV